MLTKSVMIDNIIFYCSKYQLDELDLTILDIQPCFPEETWSISLARLDRLF